MEVAVLHPRKEAMNWYSELGIQKFDDKQLNPTVNMASATTTETEEEFFEEEPPQELAPLDEGLITVNEDWHLEWKTERDEQNNGLDD